MKNQNHILTMEHVQLARMLQSIFSERNMYLCKILGNATRNIPQFLDV